MVSDENMKGIDRSIKKDSFITHQT